MTAGCVQVCVDGCKVCPGVGLGGSLSCCPSVGTSVTQWVRRNKELCLLLPTANGRSGQYHPGPDTELAGIWWDPGGEFLGTGGRCGDQTAQVDWCSVEAKRRQCWAAHCSGEEGPCGAVAALEGKGD